MNDRIKLAEAMGWRQVSWFIFWKAWVSHDGIYRDDRFFDPFTDANDCNALIKHLNGLGIAIELNLDENGYVVVQGYKAPDPFFGYEGDNWMHGVCELALKVIE